MKNPRIHAKWNPIRWRIRNGEILASAFEDDRDHQEPWDLWCRGTCCIMTNHNTQTLYIDEYGVTLTKYQEDEE